MSCLTVLADQPVKLSGIKGGFGRHWETLDAKEDRTSDG